MATTTISQPTTTAPAPSTYRAAVVNDFDTPLTLDEVPCSELEPGQIRVRVEACGLCHTDIHAAHGDWPI